MSRPSRSKTNPIFPLLLIYSLVLCGCGAESKVPGGTGSAGNQPPVQSDGSTDFSKANFSSGLPDRDTLLSGGQMAGTLVCAGCHSIPGSPIQALRAKSFDKVPGNTSWLYGPHGNWESLNMTTFQFEDNGVFNTGLPFYGFEGLGTDPTCVTNCHDPLGEGLTIAANYAATGNDKIGRVNRPIIGCEACHGGGKDHAGVASVPVPRPNAVRCGRCHNNAFPDNHVPHHPEGRGIIEDYAASNHAKSISAVTSAGANGSAVCSRCHSDEGAQTYISVINGTESYSVINELMSGEQNIGASVVQCRTCHDKHNPETLLGAKAAGLPSAWSDEFKTCNSCHQLLKTDNSLNTASFHSPNVNTNEGSNARIISDTHFDDPATTEIEGYIIDPTAVHSASKGNKNHGTCRDCHNPHKADNTINREWARSAHGGFILDAKDAGKTGVMEEAPAWAHYDFKLPSRKDCQRCHTSTGFRNMANNPSNYDPANNQFTAMENQKELLYCWACHMSNKGDLRNPGGFVMPPSYAFPPGRSMPSGLAGSYLCLNCHSGRETGQYIKNNYTDATIAGKTFSSFNSHYLAAGGILFRTIGYEYDGRDYSNNGDFRHDMIGISAVNSGTNGPCVGCHMKSGESHLFEAVRRDSSGLITEIPGLASICSKCHGTIAEAMSPAVLNSLDNGYNSAMGVLTDLLAKKGIYYNKALHPYFYNTSDPSLQIPANAFTAWPNLDTVGAAFNLNMLAHQPGAFAHNSGYTRKLLYDSIDFADDGILNNSVQALLNSMSDTSPYKNGAVQFLLGTGGGRP